MALYLIIVSAVMIGSEAGYLYPRPSVPFELPIDTSNNLKQQTLLDDSINEHEVAVSYSLPIEDYQYLKQHNEEHLNSNKNKVENVNGLSQNEIHSANQGSVPPENAVALSQNIPESDNSNPVEHVTIANEGYINSQVAKYSVSKSQSNNDNNEVLSAGKAPIANQYINYQGNNGVDIVQTIEPQVMKHIYFHVPPPDIEETSQYRAPELPKKIYKIIFVQIPSQESSNSAQIRAINEQIRNTPVVEDKTIIFVLVKKPDTVEVLPPPPPIPSEHEVLFVKYTDNSERQTVPSVMPQENFSLNQSPVLQPGLLNGDHDDDDNGDDDVGDDGDCDDDDGDYDGDDDDKNGDDDDDNDDDDDDDDNDDDDDDNDDDDDDNNDDGSCDYHD
ncbi:uncharacterized protein [Battus philenor]|uniref:uncharacterized protein n=1 Tax=Battus philenor TaxID=42288 RepID=UPI0035D00BAB